MLSRVLGLAREQMMAHFFGIGVLKSAFDVAFTVPNLFRRLFGEGALSSAFIPVFGETARTRSAAEAFAFASRVLTLLFCVLGFATAALLLAMWAFGGAVAECGERWAAVMPLMRTMLPYALLICLAAILSGMLNTFGRFAVPAFTPLVLNFAWIGAILATARWMQDADDMERLLAISKAVVAAGVLQIAVQLPSLRRLGFRFKIRLRGIMSDSRMRLTLKLMAPAALGMGLVQINVCVDKFLAMWAADYAPAALEYAERIVYLPLGVFATAFTTVLLPAFTAMAASGDRTAIGEEAARALRNLFFAMIPGMALLAALSPEIIHLLYAFEGGAFANDPRATTLAARALVCYAPGLVVFCLQKVLAPAYYAFKDVTTPLKISLACLLLNIVLNVSSILALPDGWRHTGIAGSTVACSLVNGVALFACLKRHGVSVALGGVAASAARFAVAAAPAAAVAAWAWHAAPAMYGAETDAAGWPVSKTAETAAAACAFAAAGAVYFGISAIFARKDLAAAAKALRRRKKAK